MAEEQDLRKRAERAALAERALKAARATGTVDEQTGAPANIRAIVGGVSTQEDRLSTIQRFFPDAFVDPTDPDNFLFVNPETDVLTLYNPRGFDVGDLAGIARETVQFAGGTAGALAGGGLAIPGGPPGILAGAALGGIAGTSAADALFMSAIGAQGAQDTRSTAERIAENAAIGLSGVGGPVGATATAAVKGVTRALFRGGQAGRREVTSAIDDLARFGADPSLAQATKKPALDAIETFVSRTPGGSGRIRKAVQKTNEAVANSIEALSKRLSGRTAVDPEFAGRTIKVGIEGPSGFVARFNDQADVLYNTLDEFIPPNKPTSIIQTRTVLDGLITPVPGAEKISEVLSSSFIRKLSAALATDAADSGALPYGVLKQLRSAVGRKLSGGDLLSDAPRAELKQVYAAITRDMEAVAREIGPEAERSLGRANSFYKAGLARIESVLEPVIKGKTPEKIFDAIELGGKKGATGIRAIRRSLKPDEWRVVVGSIVRRLGRATPGQQGAEGGEFSFNTFLTNWNRLDVAAKDAMFNGSDLGGLRSNLDSLARAASRIRESSQAFANPSGTGGAVVGQIMFVSGIGTTGVGLATGSAEALAFPAMLGMAVLSFNAAARLMTNTKFVAWLARTTRINANGVGAHLGRLAGIAAVSGVETRNAIIEFLNLFGESVNRSPEKEGE